MNIFLTILLFVLGLVFIIKGGDFFVDAASWIAEISGIPKIIVGATVVSIATTLPEVIVSCIAAGQGKVDMSIGNAVGSVTANTALILAIALIFMPAVIERKDYLLKSFILFGAAAFLVIVGIQKGLNLPGAVVLIILFAIFVYDNVSSANKTLKLQRSEENSGGSFAVVKEKPTSKVITVNVLKFIFGTAGIVIGAQLLVNNGSEIARHLGVSEAIISITMIAIGTSLPELVTTITSIVKKQHDLSVGNIIGANIIDLTLILPICSFIYGGKLPVSEQAMWLDMPFCLIASLAALVPALITKKFTRLNGAALLLIYVIYLTLSFIYFV